MRELVLGYDPQDFSLAFFRRHSAASIAKEGITTIGNRTRAATSATRTPAAAAAPNPPRLPRCVSAPLLGRIDVSRSCLVATLVAATPEDKAFADVLRGAAVGLAAGYASHLAVDAMTPTGLPLLGLECADDG